MASGFLILADGRCLAKRWAAYDAILTAVAEQLQDSPAPEALRTWLLSLLPGPEDEAHLGHGPWLRKSDNQVIDRKLDVRELTQQNQRLFHEAALRAGELAKGQDSKWPDWLKACLLDLADMASRADRGEPPLSRSEWREVVPSEGRKIGPGWSTID